MFRNGAVSVLRRERDFPGNHVVRENALWGGVGVWSSMAAGLPGAAEGAGALPWPASPWEDAAAAIKRC